VAHVITIHAEASRHPHRVLQSLAHADVVRGIALNPGTPVDSVEPLLDEVDLLLLLAVNPGWSGQSFLAMTERRVARAKELIRGRDILVPRGRWSARRLAALFATRARQLSAWWKSA
jgi:ribulose-phosphate 3-epimerase